MEMEAGAGRGRAPWDYADHTDLCDSGFWVRQRRVGFGMESRSVDASRGRSLERTLYTGLLDFFSTPIGLPSAEAL